MDKLDLLSKAKRVVIKIGSQILEKDDNIDRDFIESLAKQIKSFEDREFIIVSSGAVLAGIKKLGLKSKPKSITEKQAVASVGQASLIQIYDNIFSEYGITVGQMLLTVEGLQDRRRYIYAKNTLNKLLDFKVVPIINENDAIAVSEIVFGDNDFLASHVALMSDANLLIILSTAGGLYTDDPSNPDAKLINFIDDVDQALSFAKASKSTYGSGGMRSKLEASKIAVDHSIPVIIAPKSQTIITDILLGKDVGTFIYPSKKKQTTKKKSWLKLLSSPKGKIYIDQGAEKAIRSGKSLLPSGIKEVEGIFKAGDVVAISDIEGNIIGKGLINFDYREVNSIKGMRTDKAAEVLGKKVDEVIHIDNMVIF
ncbi:MAG: glutamate 5-kinase [Hydrogenothermaceae bacterium]|nr:glutamate 5-kinase [Hydrogenothermaceae bacterium]